jgi:hypothetical protein
MMSNFRNTGGCKKANTVSPLYVQSSRQVVMYLKCLVSSILHELTSNNSIILTFRLDLKDPVASILFVSGNS